MNDNQTMGCDECARKHLALALSLGKEILSGHGRGGQPDHRPDFMGELANAEHHLMYAHPEITKQIRELRHSLTVDYEPTMDMLDKLRVLWLSTLEAPESQPELPVIPPGRTLSYQVMIDYTKWNEEQRFLLNRLFAKYATFYGGLHDMLNGINLDHDGYVWYVPENTWLVGPLDLHNDYNAAEGVNHEMVCRFRARDLMENAESNPNTAIPFILDMTPQDKEAGVCLHTSIVAIDSKPCCSAARKLQVMSFVRPTTDKAMEWVAGHA